MYVSGPQSDEIFFQSEPIGTLIICFCFSTYRSVYDFNTICFCFSFFLLLFELQILNSDNVQINVPSHLSSHLLGCLVSFSVLQIIARNIRSSD